MTEAEVVTYMKTTLGPVVDVIHMTDEALTEAAKFMQSIYGVDYAQMEDGAMFRALSDFFALNGALNFAATFYKFTADGASVEGKDVFDNLNARWQHALSMAQSYLSDAGLSINAPGAAITPRNYGWRFGAIDTNYLQDAPQGI